MKTFERAVIDLVDTLNATRIDDYELQADAIDMQGCAEYVDQLPGMDVIHLSDRGRTVEVTRDHTGRWWALGL